MSDIPRSETVVGEKSYQFRRAPGSEALAQTRQAPVNGARGHVQLSRDVVRRSTSGGQAGYGLVLRGREGLRPTRAEYPVGLLGQQRDQRHGDGPALPPRGDVFLAHEDPDPAPRASSGLGLAIARTVHRSVAVCHAL